MTGDDGAEFRAYVTGRLPTLLRTAYLLTGDRDDAEDLVQATLARLFVAWRGVRDREALDVYVRRTMVNIHISLWRRLRGREQPAAEVPEPPARPDPTAAADLHHALWAALATLSRRQRAMVVLRYYEGLSEAETAALLGVSPGTVKSTVSRALVRLRGSAHLADVPLTGVQP